jgi:hypothetical protein
MLLKKRIQSSFDVIRSLETCVLKRGSEWKKVKRT